MTVKLPTGETVPGKIPEWKTPFNHDTNLESDRTALYCQDESRTKQEFKDECDINTILNRFLRTGEPPPMVLPDHFGDTRNNLTWVEKEQRVSDIAAMFYDQPARIRTKFNNDPMQWADRALFMLDNGMAEQLPELGIATPEELKATISPPGGTPAPETSPKAPPAPKTTETK